MVATTQTPPQPPAAAATVPSAEEEALKRNTDCVYFLASPLTCKKGSECEYRHSEYARVNPRDCYFWLNGNCLNPKCGFRHPPLDGLFGTQASVSAGSSLPPSHNVVGPATHTPYNSGKQAAPCIFFQKGLCLKGDRCAFSHGPIPTSNKISQPMAPTSGTEPLPPLKKAFGGLQKCTQEQNITRENFLKAVELPSEAKPVPKAEVGSSKNGVGVERIVLQPRSVDDDVPRYKATNIPPVVNENSGRSSRLHQSLVMDGQGVHNARDSDDFLKESSPGFDVLVDDELRDSDYYHGEDQYGRTRGHEGMNLNSVNEYDMGIAVDFSSMPDIDRETYHDPRGYESYEHMQGQYAWEQNRASSERLPAYLERRGCPKGDSPERVVESDLRYHLSKQRRANGLRSVVSHDFVPENHVEEQGYRGSSQRDPHHLPSHESSINSRLRGRIKLPSSDDLCADGEMDRGRNWSGLSTGWSQISSHQGRFRDRIRPRVDEDYNYEGRHFRGAQMRREINENITTDFTGPKSLAELKVGKNTEGVVQKSLGKRKHSEDQPPSEGDLSFEGPMPLSQILKRKREAKAAASGGGMSSVNKNENNQKESKKSLIYSSINAETQRDPPFAIKDDDNNQVLKDKEESKHTALGVIGTDVENTKVTHGRSSELNPDLPETEDGMTVDDGLEYHEYAGDDQRDGDYEYEQVDEGDYNDEDGENEDAEEEYVDEEDGDDFAKKIGVMFS